MVNDINIVFWLLVLYCFTLSYLLFLVISKADVVNMSIYLCIVE